MNQYYLHFPEPVTLEEAKEVFSVDEVRVDVIPVFSGSFLLATELSFSQVQFSLESFYADEHAPREYAVMKLKNGQSIARNGPKKSE